MTGDSQDPQEDEEIASVSQISWQQISRTESGGRKERLAVVIEKTEQLGPVQRQKLVGLLQEQHAAFSLEKEERGETNLIEMEISTGEAEPKRQPARRMLHIVRQEVARQLREMQNNGVIQPSSSPWASPVVMVRKKDGTHRFCVDYRQLNAVTKADTYPLPRIDDLLDQLGECKYFTTLDLASGYWQIRVQEQS